MNSGQPRLIRHPEGGYVSPSGRYRITAKRGETGLLLFWKVRDTSDPSRNLPPCHYLAHARNRYGTD